jgi:hypothetical protein
MLKIEIPIDMKRNIIVFTGTLVFFVYSGITVASVMLELNIAVMICTFHFYSYCSKLVNKCEILSRCKGLLQ